jgi:hypothetical protein
VHVTVSVSRLITCVGVEFVCHSGFVQVQVNQFGFRFSSGSVSYSVLDSIIDIVLNLKSVQLKKRVSSVCLYLVVSVYISGCSSVGLYVISLILNPVVYLVVVVYISGGVGL